MQPAEDGGIAKRCPNWPEGFLDQNLSEAPINPPQRKLEVVKIPIERFGDALWFSHAK